jgi:hypothetical protein
MPSSTVMPCGDTHSGCGSIDPQLRMPIGMRIADIPPEERSMHALQTGEPLQLGQATRLEV